MVPKLMREENRFDFWEVKVRCGRSNDVDDDYRQTLQELV